jgi:hypothetical protein
MSFITSSNPDCRAGFLNQGTRRSDRPRFLFSPAQARIQKEVRHELLMLPYFGVFDNIAFEVSGNTVTRLGQVTRPTRKSDSENRLKHIEGVEHVDNRIEVLPPSPMDDQLRLSLYRSNLRLCTDGEVCFGSSEADTHHRKEWTRHSRRRRG